MEGHAILYADVMTDSMRRAHRRDRRAAARRRLEYNERNGITPQSIIKPIDMSLVAVAEGDYVTVPLEDDEEVENLTPEQRAALHRRAGGAHARGRTQVRV